MNSLAIFQIKEINNIILNYKTHFENINKLEVELENKCFILKFKCFTGKEITLDVDIKNNKLFITYDNNTINLIEFHEILDKSHKYVRDAIYHYFIEYIINRYYMLPFDDSYYYYRLEDILDFIFGSFVWNIFEQINYYNFLETIDEEKTMCLQLNRRNFLDEVIFHIKEVHPFQIRDNTTELYDFFERFKK